MFSDMSVWALRPQALCDVIPGGIAIPYHSVKTLISVDYFDSLSKS